MKPTTKNRWLKLLAWLLVLVIIIMLILPNELILPKELTDDQFAQIKPGMTMVEVKRLLGKPREEIRGEDAIIAIPSGNGARIRKDYLQDWYVKGRWWKPSLSASIPVQEVDVLSGESSSWIGKTDLFWVDHKNGIVIQTWMYPLTRTGGGLQGCIDTIKEYWNQWWSK